MPKYQFTLFSKTSKPVSTIVEAESRQDFVLQKAPYIKAMQKIMAKRGWSMADVKQYGYTTWKVKKADEVGA
jgi:hypothetical protein